MTSKGILSWKYIGKWFYCKWGQILLCFICAVLIALLTLTPTINISSDKYLSEKKLKASTFFFST
jgi:hypothetical protein